MTEDKFPRFSGVDFISKDAFPIENSPTRKRLTEDGKIVDFVRKLGSELLFVEVKSSFPNPNNTETPESFSKEIAAICDKFTVSLKIFSAIKVGVTEDILPDALSYADKVKVTLAVVICKFEKEEWCVPIKNALLRNLPDEIIKLWMPTIKVYTIAAAKEFTLI
ncbi:MAG: hypothetical protein LBK06_09590 [Planctomycetaceae bacterium]|jgi:hypothetical protein|nr:hypothetical protein [Planctomycetaceae bacterium]